MKHTIRILQFIIVSLFLCSPLYAQDTMSTAVNIGTKSTGFIYSDTKNTNNYTSANTVKSAKDVFYKFTLTTSMLITISHCGSEVNDTYLQLLDASGTRIAYNDDTTTAICSSRLQSFLLKELAAGTYYIVSEGYSANGNITTKVEGIILSNLGSKSSTFSYRDTRNRIAYKFTTTRMMDFIISHCQSALQETSLYLYNSAGTLIKKCTEDTFVEGCYTGLAYIEYENLPSNVYYVVSSSNIGQNLVTTIDGTVPSPTIIDVGSNSSSFVFTDTQNTTTLKNAYLGLHTNDVYHKFTITSPMDITISHCGSEISDTYVYLLNSSMSLIDSNDNYDGPEQCTSNNHAFLRKKNLAAGIYYVVSEGKITNGKITTTIRAGRSMANIQNNASGQNYITTITPRVATSDISNLSSSEMLHSVQYFDGLGRPTQTVLTGAAPDGSDIVTMQGYDSFGRPDKAWLPISVSSNNGNFVDNFTSLATNFYNDANPFAETKYEASPLNRVIKELGAGEAWHNTSKGVVTDYLTNDQSPTLHAKYFTVDSNNQLINNGTYGNGQLYVKKITDEDGKFLYEFTDKLGRKILQRRIFDGANLDTYLIYDDFNNVRYVLPPLASYNVALVGTYSLSDTEALRIYGYYYRYDERNRCIEKKFPGADPIYLIYDRTDKLVCTQTGNQRLNGLWIVTKYDVLGRIVYTSEVKNPAAFEAQRKSFSAWWVTESFSTQGHTYPMEDTGYSRGYYHIAPTRLLEVYYYDTYDFIDLPSLSTTIKNKLKYQSKTGYGVKSDRTKSLLTGKRTYQLNDPTKYTLTAYYYDEKGNIIQECSTNMMGGYEALYKLCDFTGNVIKSHKEYATSMSNTNFNSEQYDYTYDHANRLSTISYSDNTGAKLTMSENCYDSIGRLKIKKLNNNAFRMHYKYNIRNWVEKIAAEGYTNPFEQHIYYNTNPRNENVCFNGNISAVTWKYNTTVNGYKYQYDSLNRLTSAKSTLGTNMSGAITTANDYEEAFTYDYHGNVKSLIRKVGGYGLVDCLTYEHNGNQVKSIIEEMPDANVYNLKEYKGGSGGSGFVFDKNGNMIKDSNGGIVMTTYNLLNLPDTVQFANGNQIINHYSADGKKLRADYITMKTPLSNPATSVQKWTFGVDNITQYADIFCEGRMYKETKTTSGDKLEFVRSNTPDGYMKYTTGTNGSFSSSGFFYVKDYLGNVREVISRTNNFVQKMQYFPSGLPWKTSLGQSTQPFKVTEKEFVEVHGYDRYDFTGRIVAPGRFGFDQADPMLELYYFWSPYAYCMGNPVRYFDPDGRSTHVDKNGNVIQVRNDGDLGVYMHSNTDNWEGADLPTDGNGVTRIGDTWTVLGFADFDHYEDTGEIRLGKNAFIDFESEWATEKVSEILDSDPSAIHYATKAGQNGDWDIKRTSSQGFYYGSKLFGKYASARDAGNFAAGAVVQKSKLPNLLLDFGLGAYNITGNSKVLTGLLSWPILNATTSVAFTPQGIAIMNLIGKHGEHKLSKAGIEAGKSYIINH